MEECTPLWRGCRSIATNRTLLQHYLYHHAHAQTSNGCGDMQVVVGRCSKPCLDPVSGMTDYLLYCSENTLPPIWTARK